MTSEASMATTDAYDEWDESRDAPDPTLRVLLYSDDAHTRDAIKMAVGRRVSADLPPVEWVEVATPPVVVSTVDAGGLDLLILDGEAGKAGGMGLSRQLKDEIFRCPPVLLLIGRPQDAWLASWSNAEAVVSRPLDPIAVQEAVLGLLRPRTSA
jgi:DNA-binding response OmpR family regulator